MSALGGVDDRPHLCAITTPASASTGQRKAQRLPRDLLKLLWLDLADVLSARRAIGAGDGNRTHLSRSALLVGSITYERRPRRV